MAPPLVSRHRLLQVVLLAFFGLFSALYVAPRGGALPATGGAVAADASQELAAEEATLAGTPSSSRKSTEQGPPLAEPAPVRPDRRAILAIDAARHAARLACYDPPARSPPFRLLN